MRVSNNSPHTIHAHETLLRQDRTFQSPRTFLSCTLPIIVSLLQSDWPSKQHWFVYVFNFTWMELFTRTLLLSFCSLALCLLHTLRMLLFSLVFQGMTMLHAWSLMPSMGRILGCFLCLIITAAALCILPLPLVNTGVYFHWSKSLDVRVYKYSLWSKVLESCKIVVPVFPLLIFWEYQLGHTLMKALWPVSSMLVL